MSLIESIIAFFSSLFGTKPKPPAPPPAPPVTPRPTVPPDSATEPAQIVTSKVLVIVYDPVVDSATGKRLSEHLRWSRADDLITNYMDDITETSKGLARYQIVQRVEVDEFLPLEDGFSYTIDTYLSIFRHTTAQHSPEWLDYNAFLTRFNILQRVRKHELDEVWVFAFPYAGFYEFVMAGRNAFWCNSHPLPDTDDCPAGSSSWDSPSSAVWAKCSNRSPTAANPSWKRCFTHNRRCQPVRALLTLRKEKSGRGRMRHRALCPQ